MIRFSSARSLGSRSNHGPARRSRPAAAEAPASLPRGVCAESQAQAHRHGTRDRQRRQKRGDATPGGHGGDGHATEGCCDANHAMQKPRSHDTSRIAWAKLMARVGEEFPLECPACGGDIRLIALHQSQGRSGRSSHILANRSSRHQSQPRGALRPTGTSSCRSRTTATSFKRRIDELHAIDIHSL